MLLTSGPKFRPVETETPEKETEMAENSCESNSNDSSRKTVKVRGYTVQDYIRKLPDPKPPVVGSVESIVIALGQQYESTKDCP